ncbi:fungal transcriptional regulatory protein [Ilyonectria robusta]|uniref:fungal transcriptional regulatory protein n=1 Tax=Ilyonectria robusta TaxID=1079257 RepID=UPI001E8DA9FB|nr:fungal transcriptional regulatory protein [Ilyonectria robusta]KAH8714562.1 fungal transcriptional regulatory protein [Ilyonectria robusta]
MSPNGQTIVARHAGEPAAPAEPAEPKARKACINCRRQKMKCRIDSGNICRRCRRSGNPCIFVPRSNASVPFIPGSLPLTDPTHIEFNSEILRRLQSIEEYIGLSRSKPNEAEAGDEIDMNGEDELQEEDSSLNSLWEAVRCLERISPSSIDALIWRRSTIKHLWQIFNEKTPGLHFLPSKQRFSAPRPLLLASILYCSSTRGTTEVAELAPHYFNVLCNAIAQLSIPNSEIGHSPDDPGSVEEWAFQTVLAIILAGLLTEGSVRETGIWISVAHRLILENCPPHIDERSRDWRKLFTGVQIVDLEHASLHMAAPVIPREPPLPSLTISHRDQLYRLSRMMHTGLTHFTGRGLPTIWSCFTGSPSETTWSAYPFSPVDAAVIRDWARQLDDWLVEFSKEVDDSEQDRQSVFRQYVLHRLLVLSIYHPARGCNLHSNSITPKEQYELLLSARATLKLHLNDKAIWSNWDLVMITWAALIVIQGVEGGNGEADDLGNIRIHLDFLRQTNEPKPSLHDKLATRLEQSLQGMQTPSPTALHDPMSLPVISPDLDYSWQIFNQASLDQVTFGIWPETTDIQPIQ